MHDATQVQETVDSETNTETQPLDETQSLDETQPLQCGVTQLSPLLATLKRTSSYAVYAQPPKTTVDEASAATL